MKRVIKYIILNSLYGAAIYFAIFESNNGAENIVIALTWLLFLVSLVCLTDVAVNTLRDKGRSVPKFIDFLYDSTVIGVFIYHGWWFTGMAYIVHAMLISVAWYKAELTQDDEEEGTP